MNKGRGWYNHSYEHALASKGIQTKNTNRIDKSFYNNIDKKMAMATLEEHPNIYTKPQSSDTGGSVEFKVDFGGKGLRNIDSSVSFHPFEENKLNTYIRFPAVYKVDKNFITKLRDFVKEINEATPFNANLEFGVLFDETKSREVVIQEDVDEFLDDDFTQNAIYYPHIGLKKKVRNEKEYYDFLDFIKETVDSFKDKVGEHYET